MAVLFPTRFGQVLSPKQPAQVLQAFLNIQNVEGVQNGQLTKANLDSYAKKRFLAQDPSADVANYFSQKFNDIAKLDGNANSISVDDLVDFRTGLPDPDHVAPPTNNPPATGGGSMEQNIQLILFFVLQFFQQMFRF